MLEETAGKRPVEICLLPGVYRLTEPLRVEKAQLKIRGCGEQTQIIGPARLPVLLANKCDITVEAMAIRGTAPGGAIVLTSCQNSKIFDCVIENNILKPKPIDTASGETVERAFSSAKIKNRGVKIDKYERELIKHRINRYLPRGIAVRPSVTAYFPALVVRETKGIEIYNNDISGFPSIIIQAKDGEVSHNRMTQGGTWVQDGSSFIQIVENQIVKGYGPGVLLGGVKKKKHLALESAGVQNVSVARNQILLMGDSGIASATEIDNISGLGDLEDIRITDNYIEGCGQHPITTLDGEGVGGVILKNGSQICINDNVIRHNGSQQQPACGILIEDSEEVSILNNAIQENGSSVSTMNECIDFSDHDDGGGEKPLEVKKVRFENLKPENGMLWRIESNVMGINKGSGLRCQSGMRITLAESTDQLNLLLIGSEAHIRVLDTAGKELEKTINTPVNVQTPRKVTFRQNGMKVVEIAASERLWLQQACTGGATSYQAGIAALFVYGDDFLPPNDNSPFYTHEPGRSALTVQGNTVVTPAGQALWVVGAGQMMITDNELVSRNEYIQPVPDKGQGEVLDTFWLNVAQVGKCASIINLGIALEFSDLLVNAGFSARPGSISSSKAVPAANSGREIPPGLLQFNDNQVLFYTSSPEQRLVYPSCFVLSFDDASFQSNQVRSDVENGLQIMDVVVMATTTRVNNNRFAETFTGAYASLLSFAMMNTTLGNIATHCILAFARTGNLFNQGNQIAITQNCVQKVAGVASHVPNMVSVEMTNVKSTAGGNRDNG